MQLSDFKVLTFDCYGTLIDWESGIHTALQPLLRKGGVELTRDNILETFARHESAQEAETPAMIYSRLLGVVHARLAQEWGVAASEEDNLRFGAPCRTGRPFRIQPPRSPISSGTTSL